MVITYLDSEVFLASHFDRRQHLVSGTAERLFAEYVFSEAERLQSQSGAQPTRCSDYNYFDIRPENRLLAIRRILTSEIVTGTPGTVCIYICDEDQIAPRARVNRSCAFASEVSEAYDRSPDLATSSLWPPFLSDAATHFVSTRARAVSHPRAV